MHSDTQPPPRASQAVTRTGVTTEALTTNVSVLETGNMIDGTQPTTLTFAADSTTVDLDIDTEDDSVDEPNSTIFVGVTLPNSIRSRTLPPEGLCGREPQGVAHRPSRGPSSRSRARRRR